MENILNPASNILCIIFRDLLMADVTTPTQTGMDKATGVKLEAKGKY
jgi:hypothetical protein